MLFQRASALLPRKYLATPHVCARALFLPCLSLQVVLAHGDPREGYFSDPAEGGDRIRHNAADAIADVAQRIQALEPPLAALEAFGGFGGCHRGANHGDGVDGPVFDLLVIGSGAITEQLEQPLFAAQVEPYQGALGFAVGEVSELGP